MEGHDNDTPRTSTAFDLGADCVPVEFTYRGVTFEVEAFEAMDELQAIDIAHAHDPQTCRKCGRKFIVPSEIYGKVDEYSCPADGCGATGLDLLLNQSFLDDVARLLADKYRLTGIGRTAAGAYYAKVVSVAKMLKKNVG